MEETQDGSYILDANDLCMIEHVAALAQAGVTSLKIEGRAKAAFYVAGTVNAYRMAVDGYAASGCSPEYHPPEWVREETEKVSHRPYGTGFYFGIPGQNVRAGGYVRPYEVAAVSEEWRDGRLRVSQRNRFSAGMFWRSWCRERSRCPCRYPLCGRRTERNWKPLIMRK